MKMLKAGDKYTQKNPYTGITKTGIVVEVDEKNETMIINTGTEIFYVGS